MRSNKALKNLYEKVYLKGKENFFTSSNEDIFKEVLEAQSWRGKLVLDAGCGTGELAYALALKGAEVLAIDYSKNAIEMGKRKFKHKNLTFEYRDLNSVSGEFDVITMLGAIEHTDDPFETLKKLKHLTKDDGKIIVACPSFLNIRGYIWMSLLLLLDVPMSLTDLHYICPFDMERWARRLNLKIRWKTIRQSLGSREKMIVDMKKRLKNALRDAKLNNKNVDKLMDWLREAIRYDNRLSHTGAVGIYFLEKQLK